MEFRTVAEQAPNFWGGEAPAEGGGALPLYETLDRNYMYRATLESIYRLKARIPYTILVANNGIVHSKLLD